ncbi:HNH endonuclease signature motif containing protein [Parafrigoribacterium humi]|uniref:HNH endonuclease signature motif containing protein n=1 Tax=Parafrigoribacterium humi TaxID=3144664 RepID=UPI0032EBA119
MDKTSSESRVNAEASAGATAAQHSDALDALSDSALLEALAHGFAQKREAEAQLVRLAAEVVERSRSSLGLNGLSIRAGSGNPAALLADLGHITLAEAHLICRVAESTADRVSLVGERMQARYPLVAEAVLAAHIPIDSANHIVAALDQAAPRAEDEHLVAAERALVEFACDNPADIVRKLALRWRDALDVDGIEPREDDLVQRRSLRRTILANGMKRYQLDLDPLNSAYLDAAIDAHVGAVIRAPRFWAGEGQASGSGAGDGCGTTHEELPDPRTLTQIAADAMVQLARHGIACTKARDRTGRSNSARNNSARNNADVEVPLPAATIVVRMTLESLLSGLGEAQIDGIEQPISAKTARWLAADAQIIPAVLGGNSEVLDLGTPRRLFTRAQRIALAERDDGCAWAGCRRPPSHTEAHHLRWWSHGGATNLNNGILLCSMHHHRVHRDGWGIRIRDNVPWFIPPSTVDICRTPRRGGRLPVPEIRQLAG